MRRWRLPAANGRREAIAVALAAAEVSWLSAIVLALSGAAHVPLLLWLGLLTILLGFFYGYRALERAGLSVRVQQGLLVLVLLLAIALLIRGHLYAGLEPGRSWLAVLVGRLSDLSTLLSRELLAAALMVLLWGRALHLARRSLSIDSVGYTFRAGIVIFVWVSLGLGLLGGRDVAPFVLPYFFFALLAVALARIEEVSHLPGGTRAPFSAYWVGSAVVAVAVLVLAGAMLGAFFSGNGLQPLLRLLSPLVFLVIGLLVGIALLIFGLLQAILAGLNITWGGMGQALQDLLDRLGRLAAGFRPPAEGTTDPGLLRSVQLGGNLLLIAVLIAAVVIITWARLRHLGEKQANETRESLRPELSLAEGLADLLRAGRQRLAELAGRAGLSRLLAALSIRHIYANLVRLAAGLGYPRAPAQTPYEYLDTLYQALPNARSEAAMITDAYVRAHYGQLPDTPEALQRIRDAWNRIRSG